MRLGIGRTPRPLDLRSRGGAPSSSPASPAHRSSGQRCCLARLTWPLLAAHGGSEGPPIHKRCWQSHTACEHTARCERTAQPVPIKLPTHDNGCSSSSSPSAYREVRGRDGDLKILLGGAPRERHGEGDGVGALLPPDLLGQGDGLPCHAGGVHVGRGACLGGEGRGGVCLV